MVRTLSTMLPLGTPAPDFALPDAVSGRTVRKGDFDRKRGLLVIFMCNHCPFVKHVREGLARFSKEYASKDLAVVGINANDPASHPDDAPAKMKAEAAAAGYAFPYLYDESQEVAKAYTAACTPDFFLFGPDRRLAYRGQFDDSRPESGIPVSGKDLRAAVDALLAGRPVPKEQKPSVGCNVKWRAGNEPPYFGPR
jgi:thiol-disulfide isomerase/thioredoxin